jgi:hypothetical protein
MKKKQDIVIIGEGDDLIENWYFGFDSIDTSLNNFINEATEHGLKVKWNIIIKMALEISNVKRNFKPENSLDMYNFIDDLCINNQNWGGESLGRSGSHITITAHKDKINEIKKSLTVLLNMLDHWWKENRFIEVILENECTILRNQTKESLNKISFLSNELIYKEEQVEMYKKEIINKTTLTNELTSILSFLINPSSLFLCIGPILLTQQKLIFIITNHKQFNAHEHIGDLTDILKKKNLGIVEVYEYELNGSELSHISVFQSGSLNMMRGWAQKNTELKCINNTKYDVKEIREKYINWSKDIGT